jgi:hypothetical protein
MAILTLTVVDVLLGILFCYILYALFTRIMSTRNRLPYPPGPPGLPFIGLTKAPADPSWVTYRDWSEKYGAPHLCAPLLHRR